MTSEYFLPAFWPNFVSTIAGVLFGVPIALWLNRRAVAHGEKTLQKAEREFLTHGLGAVKTALEHYGVRLRTLMKALAEGTTLFDLDVDVFAWQAVRDQVVPLLRSADLQRQLAFHFGRLSQLARLWASYVDMTTGVWSVVGGVERTQVALEGHIAKRAEELAEEVQRLITSVDIELGKRGAP